MGLIDFIRGLLGNQNDEVPEPVEPYKSERVYCYEHHRSLKLVDIGFYPAYQVIDGELEDRVSCQDVAQRVNATHLEGRALFDALLTAKDGDEALSPVCPVCNHDLKLSFDIWGTPIIPMVGGTGAGKSCYIGMLWDKLNQLRADNSISLRIRATPVRGQNQIEALRHGIIQERRVPIPSILRGGEVKTLVPVQIELRSPRTGFKTSAVLYDIAGEAFRPNITDEGGDAAWFQVFKESAIHIHTDQVAGIIFIIDPSACTSIESGHVARPETRDGLLGRDPATILPTLIEYLKMMKAVPGSQKIDISLSLVLTKFDKFLPAPGRTLNPDIMAKSVAYREAYQRNEVRFLQSALGEPGSEDAESFLSELHMHALDLFKELGIDGLYEQCVDSFAETRCFAVSALGYDPLYEESSDESSRAIVNKVESMAVELPFLWLLLEQLRRK